MDALIYAAIGLIGLIAVCAFAAFVGKLEHGLILWRSKIRSAKHPHLKTS